MAGPLEQFFPWLDEKKARALRALGESAAKVPDEVSRLFHHPLDTTMEGIRGALSGEAGTADAIINSVPGAMPAESFQGALEERVGKGHGLVESLTNMTGASPGMAPLMATLGGWRMAKNLSKAGDSSYLDRMLEAKRMREAGAKPEEIWDKVKIDLQKEGALKFWLPGMEDAKVNLSGVTGKTVPAKQLYDYPLLYKAAPELEGMGTQATLGKSKGGSFFSFNYPELENKKVRAIVSGEDMDELEKVIRHEIGGHAPQSYEKHSEGASYEEIKELIEKIIKGHPYITPQGSKDARRILDSEKFYDRNLGEMNAVLGEKNIPDRMITRPSDLIDMEHAWTDEKALDSTLRALVQSILKARLKGEKPPNIDPATVPIVDMPLWSPSSGHSSSGISSAMSNEERAAEIARLGKELERRGIPSNVAPINQRELQGHESGLAQEIREMEARRTAPIVQDPAKYNKVVEGRKARVISVGPKTTMIKFWEGDSKSVPHSAVLDALSK